MRQPPSAPAGATSVDAEAASDELGPVKLLLGGSAVLLAFLVVCCSGGALGAITARATTGGGPGAAPEPPHEAPALVEAPREEVVADDVEPADTGATEDRPERRTSRSAKRLPTHRASPPPAPPAQDAPAPRPPEASAPVPSAPALDAAPRDPLCPAWNRGSDGRCSAS